MLQRTTHSLIIFIDSRNTKKYGKNYFWTLPELFKDLIPDIVLREYHTT